jgi:hypothetical protein
VTILTVEAGARPEDGAGAEVHDGRGGAPAERRVVQQGAERVAQRGVRAGGDAAARHRQRVEDRHRSGWRGRDAFRYHPVTLGVRDGRAVPLGDALPAVPGAGQGHHPGRQDESGRGRAGGQPPPGAQGAGRQPHGGPAPTQHFAHFRCPAHFVDQPLSQADSCVRET